MVRIKLHSLENYFKRKLEENRIDELKNTKIVHFFSTLMHFCFYASPLVASCSAISMYNVLHPVNLDSDLAYFIIILVGNLQGPLISLASSVDELQSFMSAWRSISVFFQKIDDQVIPNIKSEHLEKGEVVFDKAIFSINDKAVKKVYNEIMRHKVHKRRVKQGLYYVVENIEGFERRDSNVQFHVPEFKTVKKIDKDEAEFLRVRSMKLKQGLKKMRSRVEFKEDNTSSGLKSDRRS